MACDPSSDELYIDIPRDRTALRGIAYFLRQYARFLDDYAGQEIDDELAYEERTGWGFPIACTRQEILVHLEAIVGDD